MASIPRNIGPYRVLEPLGQGGMGQVYRAFHTRTNEVAALKTVLLPHHRALGALRREIHALSTLRHPGIVRIVEEGLQDGRPWYAMELVRGESLRSMVGAPIPEVLRLVRRLCSPLAFLHGEGLVHRDLKPENVMLREGSWPVIVDLGVVGQTEGPLTQELVETGTVPTGTAPYMPPEQSQGGVVDARADLYSLGCMLYELLTGQPPFVAAGPFLLMLQHCNAPPRPPSALNPKVAPALDALVLHLLAKQPEARPGYAEDVAHELDRILDAPPEPYGPLPRRHLYRPRLVGRAEVLRSLEERLESLKSGQGGFVLIEGERGSGKTRLLGELAHRAAEQSVRVLLGECRSGGPPLHPLASPLQRLADHCQELGLAEARKLLGSTAGLLAPYEPALAAFTVAPPPSSKPPARVSGEQQLFLAISAAFSALAQKTHRNSKPLLLVLDDLHWADPLTLGWLSSLRPAPASALLIVATLHPGAAPAAWKAAPRLALQPLGAEAIREMAGDMLAVREVPPELQGFLERGAGGSPLAVAELLHLAAEESVLSRDEQGRWRLDPGCLPANPRELGDRRLARLSPAARRLVEAVAVFGRPAHSLEVWRVAKLEGNELLEASSEALRGHLLEELDGEKLKLAHSRLLEAAYAGIGVERLEVLHRAAANALEKFGGFQSVTPHAELALHWEKAGERRKACEHAFAGARQAHEQLALAEAERLAREALRLAGSFSPDSLPILGFLAQEVLYPQGRQAEACTLLLELLELARLLGRPEEESQALRRLVATEWALGRLDRARQYAEEALRVARGLGNPALVGGALNHLGVLDLSEGRYPEARACLEEALRLVREQGGKEEELSVLGNLANLAAKQGRVHEAEVLMRHVLGMARQLKDPFSEGLSLLNLLRLALDRGQSEPARRIYEEASPLLERLGHQGFLKEFLELESRLEQSEGAG